MTTREKIRSILDVQPDDASYDKILPELTFRRRVDRGLSDARRGRVISDEEMAKRIDRWQC